MLLRRNEVQAAGGVVLRQAPGGPREVLLIHRPAYDDWTLPKGKLNGGETPEGAAVREVEEETGLSCKLGRPVGRVRYRDRRGRAKVVHYWLMEPLEGTDGVFVPNDEVDRIRWVPLAEAPSSLTYDHDKRLLANIR